MEIRELKKYLNKNFDLLQVKGKFIDLLVKNQPTKLKKVYLLRNPQLSRQMCFLITEKQIFCGCILARQSSDFMVKLAKQLITDTLQSLDEDIDGIHWANIEKIKFNLIQLRFPNDFQSLKLIVLTPLDGITMIADFFAIFELFGKNMNTKIKKIIKI
ncbi:MAG: hypothetical protein ACTSYU_10850 [Promethearchaeota archaeon]